VLWRQLGVRAQFRGVFYRGINSAASGPGIFGNLLFTVGVFYQFGGRVPANEDEPTSRLVLGG
jgi:hypothetical protein